MIFATKDGDAYAVISAVRHGHPDDEIWFDATLGSWQEPFTDHQTFSGRINDAGASLVDGLVASRGEADYYGRRLTRQEGLEHQLLGAVWELVDEMMTVPELASSA